MAITSLADFETARQPVSDVAKEIAAKAHGAAAPLKTVAQGRSDVFYINPYDLQVKSGWNGRIVDSPENIEYVNKLAADIAENGVKRPLSVYNENGITYVSDGHCRLLATFQAIEDHGAEIVTVPCIAERKGTSEADRVANQISYNSGKNFTPLEMSGIVKRLQSFGWDDEQIAKRVGLSKQRVTQLTELSAVEPEVVAMVKTGTVSATTAANVVREVGVTAATPLLKEAVKVAKAAGKEKATAKHVAVVKAKAGNGSGKKDDRKKTEGAKPVYQEKLRQVAVLIEDAYVNKDGRDVNVTFKKPSWARICALLGIDDVPGTEVGRV